MKLFVFALFVTVATAAAAPLDDSNGPVELIVNGVPDGQALELGDIVDIKLNEHAAGEVVATDLLHPLTAVGIAEAAAAAVVETPEAVILPAPAQPEVAPEAVILPAPAQPEVAPEAVILPAPAQPEVAPEAVILPAPAQPEVAPEAVILPAPAQPEVAPEAVILPAPAQPEVAPEAVILPAPAQPEVAPEAVILPAPAQPEVEIEPVPVPAAQLPNGEVYNDGTVQITVNGPETGIVSTVQGWFNMVLNYFSDGVQTTQHII